MKRIFTLFVVAICIVLSAGDASAHPAWGIVVDRQGQIYFSDLETVWKIDVRGKVAVFRQGVSGRHVHDITIDADDNLYGIDNAYDARTETFPRGIWKMTPKGEFSYLVPMTAALPSGANIWRDSEGNTYSVEPHNNEKKEVKIIKRTPKGEASLLAGGSYGFADGQKDKARFSIVTDMAFGKDGASYLTDGNKVRKIDRAGTVTTVFDGKLSAAFAKGAKTSARLFGLAVDEQSNIFVAEPENRRVLKIAPSGESAEIFIAESPWQPTGVALRGNEIFFMESWHNEEAGKIGTRVLKFDGRGKATVLATVGDPAEEAKEEQKKKAETAGTQMENENKFPPTILGVAGVGTVILTAVLVGGWRYCRKLFA